MYLKTLVVIKLCILDQGASRALFLQSLQMHLFATVTGFIIKSLGDLHYIEASMLLRSLVLLGSVYRVDSTNTALKECVKVYPLYSLFFEFL